MTRPDEVTADFDRLRADVAAWCRAMLPCLEFGCSHPAAHHGDGGGACRRCGCWSYAGRHGQIVDQVTVTIGRSTADDLADLPTPHLEDPR